MKASRQCPFRSTSPRSSKGSGARRKRAWDDALVVGEEFGYRNAQATVIAPTGTIGLVMDCDTTGVEPDFALVKFKKLAGGGYFKIINRCVPEALADAGLHAKQIDDIVAYAVGHGTLEGYDGRAQLSTRCAPRASAKKQIGKIEARAGIGVRHPLRVQQVDAGADFCTEVLKLDAAALDAPDFDMLKALGFAKRRPRRREPAMSAAR